MLPLTLQFVITLIASANIERIQRKLGCPDPVNQWSDPTISPTEQCRPLGTNAGSCPEPGEARLLQAPPPPRRLGFSASPGVTRDKEDHSDCATHRS
jgi:hypothetical protein